jgi:hypothetical protein
VTIQQIAYRVEDVKREDGSIVARWMRQSEADLQTVQSGQYVVGLESG